MTKRVNYVACPICGMNKVVYSASRVDKGKSASLKWADFDVETMEFVQTREGGGKGSGFTKVSALTLEQAVSLGEPYVTIAKQVGTQLDKAYKEFKRLGLIP